MKKSLLAIVATLAMAATAFAGLDTTTYIDASGGALNNADLVPSGSVVDNGGGSYTLMDIDGGDYWNGGDQHIYLHDSNQETGDFTATVRVVSQTEAIDGRWGKAGIIARSALDGNSANAATLVALGNGSQVGGANPVPVRISGRTQNDGNGGFETGIPAVNSGLAADGDGNVANNFFLADGSNSAVWLNLSYTAATNEFVSGVANDVNGAPGAWDFSPPVSNVPADGDGWYVGIGYSVHNDMATDEATRMHGVTFDNYAVPEPSSLSLLVLAGLGLLGRRRRS